MSRANYGKATRIARAFAGLSQKDLAKAIGLSQGAVSLIQANQRNPSLKTIQKIALATGCSTFLFVELAEKADRVNCLSDLLSLHDLPWEEDPPESGVE